MGMYVKVAPRNRDSIVKNDKTNRFLTNNEQ